MLFSLMHIVHVLGVILWIGGLGFITILIFPLLLRSRNPLEKVLLFRRIEHKFAPLARVYNLVVGVSGFVMLFVAGWHNILFTSQGRLLLFMVIVWTFWAVMLFGLEPLVVKRMLDKMTESDEEMDIDGIFRMMNKLHWLLLFVSLTAASAGVLFAHGTPF
ncbi:MAG: hypothetical protein V3W31_04835 [Thermodesulfobacteriota bacterium]